jgi:uncharacterized protein (TIGR02996 family)
VHPHPLQAQLLAEVLADPDSDAPRLVYADWLTDQGDPRGDFIHKQLRLAHTAEADPGYSALYAETERLWLRHGRGWSPPVEGWGPAIALRARRGLLDEVSLRLSDKKPVAPLPALARGAPLRAAWLYLDGLTWSEVLWSLEGVRLRELHMERPYGGYREEDPVPGALSGLTALGLTCESLDTNPPGVLLSMIEGARLRALSIAGSELGGQDLEPLVEAGLFEHLEHLDLSQVRAGPALVYPLIARVRPRRLGLPSFFALPRQLEEHLDWPLEALHLQGEATFGLLCSPHLHGLRHLSIGAEPLADLAQRERSLPFPRLTRLRLWRSYATGALLGALGRCSALATLRRLDLCGFWGEQELRALLSSPHLHQLVALSLPSFGDDDALALAQWPGLAHLCRLSLRCPQLGERGVRALIEAPHFEPVHLELKVPAKDKRLREMLRERFGEALKG